MKNTIDSCLRRNDTSLRRMRYLMGCFVEIEISEASKSEADVVIEAAFDEMKRIETLLSKFEPGSIVSRINQKASREAVSVTEEIFLLIEKSLEFSRLTEGAFDITVEPFLELWKTADQRGYVPSEEEIRVVSDQVGYENLLLNKDRRTLEFKREGMKIDLGAVGKGYAIDRAVAVLKKHKIQKTIINAGSTIYCLGEKARFGIEHPNQPGYVAGTVVLQDNAVSTSGDYERFLEIGGKKFGHVIHPKTGRPVESRLVSVSLVGDSAMECDILSTVYFILDPQSSSAKAALWAKISGGKFLESTISKSSKSKPGATVHPISA